MKWIKYAGGVLILFVAIAVTLTGLVSVFLTIIAESKLADVIGGVFTAVIGLYIGRAGLRIFRQENFFTPKKEKSQISVGEHFKNLLKYLSK